MSRIISRYASKVVADLYKPPQRHAPIDCEEGAGNVDPLLSMCTRVKWAGREGKDETATFEGLSSLKPSPRVETKRNLPEPPMVPDSHQTSQERQRSVQTGATSMSKKQHQNQQHDLDVHILVDERPELSVHHDWEVQCFCC